MGLKVYVNGKFVDKKDAKVSVFDHGLLYGDGVFEGIRAYGGNVFKLDAHVDRLYDSASYISLSISMTKDEMRDTILEALKINKLKDSYIRVVVTTSTTVVKPSPRRTAHTEGARKANHEKPRRTACLPYFGCW